MEAVMQGRLGAYVALAAVPLIGGAVALKLLMASYRRYVHNMEEDALIKD